MTSVPPPARGKDNVQSQGLAPVIFINSSMARLLRSC
ncbi:unnamed protein product [Brassica rapa]|uniref:Uncharacterized protein n=1 Tax=Brassica campestris TaxID=3711 RepID=A0A8D9H9X6_BRACM|nr:unnamed protein product [Brassica rapa]